MPSGVDGRAVALGLALLAASGACSRREPPGSELSPRPSVPATSVRAALPAAATRLPAEELTWVWATTPIGEMNAVILVPERRSDQRFPVLVALHGRGEALKGPERGARGWIDDYALGRAITRLAAPPLTPEDFEGHSQPARLQVLNRSLAERPYQGLIVVCPYTPDMLAGDAPFEKAPRLAEFIVGTLLPRVYRETPALATPASTGIDGVSLGGRAALTTGLLRPEFFGAVGTLQAAFDVDDAGEIAARARSALAKRPELRLRLLTSDGDYFLRANRAIGRALTRAGVAHQMLVVSGPHDYDFNRGPGALEMLVYHDRALRDLNPP